MKRFLVIGVILLVLGIALLVFLQQFYVGKKMANVTIGGRSFSLEVADTAIERSRGLQGRAELADGNGMLFIFSEPVSADFWMKDTLIPLDLIWIADGKVAGITPDVQPQPGVGDAELELYKSPGLVTVMDLGIKVGDQVLVELQ